MSVWCTAAPGRRRARASAVLVLTAALGAGSLAAAGPAAAAELVVDDDGMQCSEATYTTVQAAVDAASSGDTIKVCAGTYPERVTTTKSLTFLGAQAGKDARTGRTALEQESVLGAADGSFGFDGVTGPVVIDGFTFTGSTKAPDTPAVLLLGATDHIISNNVFASTNRAVFWNGNGVTVEKNRFVDNTQDALFIGSGEGDSATIQDNQFVNPGSSLVTVPNGDKTDGLVYQRNTQTGGGNGPVLFDTVNARIADNTVSGTEGTALLALGGNEGTTFTGNRVTGASGSGIALSSIDSRTNTGATITGNVLRNNLRGVNVAVAQGAVTIRLNELVGGTAAAGAGSGVRNATAVAVDAQNNWWGCNTGPNTSGCSESTQVSGTGSIDSDPWLVLKAALGDNTLDQGQSTSLSGDLLTNDDGASVVGEYPDGGTVLFDGGALADADPSSDQLTERVASVDLTAGTTNGSSTATATYDNATASAPYTVRDRPTVSVADVTMAEGNPPSGTTPFLFTVTLSRPSDRQETVAYTTVDGTATAPADYAKTTGSLTITAGETSATVVVPVVADRVREPDETFTLTLIGEGTSPPIADGNGTGTIVNDDAAPRIRVQDAGVTEGDSGTRPLRFVLRLDRQSSTPVTVRFTTAAGSATAGSDFQARRGTVTFAPGSTRAVVLVDVFGDTVREPNETLFLNLYGAQGATIADPNASGVIRNDD